MFARRPHGNLGEFVLRHTRVPFVRRVRRGFGPRLVRFHEIGRHVIPRGADVFVANERVHLGDDVRHVLAQAQRLCVLRLRAHGGLRGAAVREF